MKKTLTILFFALAFTASAMSPQSIENDLLLHLRKIKIWQHKQTSRSVRNRSFDSLMVESRIFKDKMLRYTQEEASTFTYAFDSLRKYIMICTSEDAKLRIYSWHTGDSESMCYYNNIFQYEAGGKILATAMSEEDEYNPRGYFMQIQNIQREKDVVYLGYFRAFYSPKDFSDSFETFRIEGSVLKDSIPIFKTKDVNRKDAVVSSVFVLYNPESLKKRKENKLLTFDSKRKQIKLTLTDNFGKILSKKLVYDFKDDQFVVIPKE